MNSKQLIETVRIRAMGLEPSMRRLVLRMAERFEGVMESEAVHKAFEDDMNASCEEPGMAVHILGSVWTIKERSESQDERLKNCDGYCDWTTREIVVEREITGNLGDMEKYIRKVTRHEIVHAFLLESGLHECAGEVESWAANEEMVDWIARQGQKIYEAWKEAGCLDE